MGDVAMLQTTVKRLRALVPNPELMVLTTNPDLLRRYCPGTVALTVESRDYGYRRAQAAKSDWGEVWGRLRLRWGRMPAKAREFQTALHGAEAVFLAGGGFLNDLNPHQTRPVLRMLTDAALRGKRTALFSQGLGPLDSPELVGLLRRACQAGTRVALREGLSGPEIMSRAEITAEQFSITGDDAVEMAWEFGPATSGATLGFSLRQVGYSEIETSHLSTLGQALARLVKSLRTRIVPLPISFNGHELDHEVIARVTGSTVLQDGMDTPEALIRATAQCRVVVTGTYHAAVFALAQGIPCVCFYVSRYYRDKMQGLADQFPGGCELVDLSGAEAATMLETGTVRFWKNRGTSLCSALRTSAEEQVWAGRRFYEAALGAPRQSCKREPQAHDLPSKPVNSRFA